MVLVLPEATQLTFYQFFAENKSLSEDIRLDIRVLQPQIMDIQFGQVMDIFKPSRMPQDSLRKHQSLVKRGPTWSRQGPDMGYLIASIRKWIGSPSSSLLIVKASPRAESRAKELATELIALLQPSPKQVAWYLSGIGPQGKHVCVADILKSLVFQLIQFDPQRVHANLGDSLTSMKLHGQHTDKEWADLLWKVAKQLRECYMIIEAEDLASLMKGDNLQITRFLGIFQSLVERPSDTPFKLKILVISYGVSRVLDAFQPSTSWAIASIQAPTLPPPGRRRLGTRSAFLHPSWQKMRP